MQAKLQCQPNASADFYPAARKLVADLFPGLPYHNLGNAHRRLSQDLPADSIYHQSTHPSLCTVLQDLWRSIRSK